MRPANLVLISTLLGCNAKHAEQAATRRLTAEEWQNTVQDLLGVWIDTEDLPVDELTAGFPNNMAGSIGELEVEQYLAAAEMVASSATSDLPSLLGCPEPTRACAKSWAPSFLERAFRRPIQPAETGRLLALYDEGQSHPEGVKLMITGALMSAHFLYRPEVRGEREGQRIRLDEYEVASRLSYLLWRTMPDEELFTAAREGQLSRPRDIVAQAERMLAHPRAGESLASWHLDWLGLTNAERLERVRNTSLEERVALFELPLEEWTQRYTDDTPLPPGVFEAGPASEALTVFADLDADIGAAEVAAYHGVELGPSFQLRGKMMAEAGEVGLTLQGGALEDPRQYRLRMSSEGDLALVSGGCDETARVRGVEPGTWVEFEALWRVRNRENTLQLKLWPEGEDKPDRPDIYCRDDESARRGTLGIWAAGPGRKGWAVVRVSTSRPNSFDFEPFALSYLAETRAFVAEWARRGGDMRELLTADWTMANQQIANAYGVDGVSGEELQPMALPAERRGILTQPLFLSTYAKPDQSSPVHRGVKVRMKLLCEQLPPPPPGVAVSAPDPSPQATTRERFVQHTEDPACAGCHTRMDPIGFGFEAFDQFGLYRTEEYGREIDTSGEIVGAPPGQSKFDDARGLVELLADSEVVRDCMVRNWYRYTVGHLERKEDPDPALLEALDVCADDDCTLQEVLFEMVTADSFRYRAMHEGDER